MSESQDVFTPQPGECWAYQTRPHESESFVVLRKVEELPKVGRVWHVSLFNLAVKNPTIPEKPHKYIAHTPIKEERLLDSLTEKLDCEIPDIDWEEGYNSWQNDHGGAFDVPLQECVIIIEEIINR